MKTSTGRSGEVEETWWVPVIRLSAYISTLIWWLQSKLIQSEKSAAPQTVENNIYSAWTQQETRVAGPCFPPGKDGQVKLLH